MESESKVHIYLDSEYATDSKSDVKTSEYDSKSEIYSQILNMQLILNLKSKMSFSF